MNISVVIPAYKNTDMLINNLKHNLPYLDGCEVIVVNDYPQESLAAEVKQFPGITLIEHTVNKGFAGAVNTGIQSARHPYIMLLNTDVKLRDTSYTGALRQFEHDPEIFAVSFAQIEKNGETVGKNRLFWKNGFLHHSRARTIEKGSTGWAEGGSSIFDATKLKKIGGFDELYNPFYWEDIDLCYRAWKQGYRVLFDPEIVVEHHHESTIGTYFQSSTITSISYRNQLICIWKNIRDKRLCLQHTVALIKRIIVSLVTDWAFIRGFAGALTKIPAIIKTRNTLVTVRTDHEILSQFTQH